jgi:hypothetical protein
MTIYLLANIDKFFAVSLIIAMSISIRFLLQIFGQRWITTTAHTATLVFLPLITYVITNLISGNIALSLGMVGALSIVRFRNPVRSPLELSVYFGAITMGIAASVSLMWLVFLGGSVLLATLVLASIHYFSKYFLNMTFFNTSFSEGNSLSTLELTLSEDVDFLCESVFLNIKKSSNEGTNYILVSKNFNELKSLLSTLKSDVRLKSYQLQK